MRGLWRRFGDGGFLVAGGIVGWLCAAALRRGRIEGLGPDGVVDAGGKDRRGSHRDRGRVRTFGIDLATLRREGGHDPAVEYLTYIQMQRGSEEHLLFVRHADLDAIAGLEGLSPEELIERLRQLDVIISNN